MCHMRGNTITKRVSGFGPPCICLYISGTTVYFSFCSPVPVASFSSLLSFYVLFSFLYDYFRLFSFARAGSQWLGQVNAVFLPVKNLCRCFEVNKKTNQVCLTVKFSRLICLTVIDGERNNKGSLSPVMLRPRGQNVVLGLGLEDLSFASASTSSICPQPVLVIVYVIMSCA